MYFRISDSKPFNIVNTSEILLYAGADGEFMLYNDDGDNYSYENGNFAAIRLTYRDGGRTLTFGKARGKFNYQENFRVKLIADGQTLSAVNLRYKGEETVICLA